MTGADVSAFFVDSDEFKAMNVDDATYQTMMYRALFDHEPESGGIAYWQNFLDQGMSRYQVFAGFVHSTEFDGICRNHGISRGTLG